MIILALLCSCYGFSEAILKILPCNCYHISNPHYKQIDDAYKKYLEVLRQNWLLKFPKSKNSDWAKYHDKYYELYSRLEGMPYRYKDYTKNLYLHDEMAEIIKKYRMKYWSEYYSKDKKKQHEEMARIQQDANRCHKANDDCHFTVTTKFVDLFDNCLKKHTILSNYYDYSLLAYMSNNFEKSFDLLSDFLDISQREGKLEDLDNLLDTNTFHNLGILSVESMAYEQAVEYLTKAIQKDPENKDLYFQRAVAYFETGQFDQAFSDYISSNYDKKIKQSKFKISKEFNQSLLKGITDGCKEGIVNFVPSLCNSIYGLEKTLWANAQLKDFLFPGPYFANAAYNAMTSFIDICKSVDQQMINECVDELKVLYQQFNQLNDTEKGHLIGYSIGKYGIEIFGFMTASKVIGEAAIKASNSYYNLRRANRICNFETMCRSEAERKAIVASSLMHEVERSSYFKNVKIHWDRQGKHVPSAHNFETGRGTILIDRSLLESLVKKHAGKGQKVLGNLGEAGYKERVDFGIIIGDYAQEIKGQPTKYFPTSKGIITYAKDGSAHVYPTNPKATFD